ncbi:hypothetical protein GYMLUDRAFT_599338 [Collybiopsis luxurians FD-317 M1]|uniref:Uncharacterized protein n=1 Tax=Collybiopsis luxurians FD-317 M1 TaxID=944289 RepID=A0A0D0BYR8_9AGAR|nr:hypothetical protein GYMLUDRAFT_599338 [Collybiopsis luxurians FD-317 M1]
MPKPLKAPKFKSKEYKNTGFTKYVVVTNPWLRPSRSQHFADGMNEWFKVMMGNSDSSTPVHSVYLQTNKDYIIVELDGSVNLDEILGAHHTEEFFQNPAPNRSHSTSEIFEYNFTRFGDPNTILKWDFVMPSTSTPAGPSELAIKKDYPPPQEPHSVNPPAMACGISSEVKEAIAARRESYERSLGKGKSSIAFGSKEGSPASTKAPIPSSSTTSSAPSSSKPTPIPHPAPPPPAPHRAPDPASASRAGPSRPPYPSSQTRGPRVKEEKDHRREANRQPDGNGFVPYAPSAMFAAMRDRRERERELERERGHGHGRDTQSDRKWDNSSSERRVGRRCETSII